MASLFEFQDYRLALKYMMDEGGQGRRGLQTRLANHIGCQQAYLSRVLAEKAELNQEQAFATSAYFNLDQLETEYFITLLNYNRAASVGLRVHYKNKLESILAKKLEIKSRIRIVDSLAPEQRATYYSDWIFCAVHVLTTIISFRTVPKIAARLKLPEARISNALEFLKSCGLVKKQGDQYTNAMPMMYLPGDSEFIRQHHMNWRLKAIESITKRDGQNLNYSGVIACSQADGVRIRELMLETLQKIREIVKASAPDESLYCYAFDFFEP